MNKTYIILAMILIILGLGMFVLESKEQATGLSPEELLFDLNENTRYITADELASRIIDGDPSVQLIDVRDPLAFRNFSLPGAKNLPLANLCSEDVKTFFTIPGKDFILYSNGDVESNKAWVLSQRLGYKRLYILKGGLNHWIATIIKPIRPAETEPREVFDRYEFRLGASQYFTGGEIAPASNTPFETISIERKKKKSAVEGGC
ncbi:MAG: rhodanese-like domain-containing protein [Bacteroidales bacterium]|nr:rhodanese-like domain-containing protein [Bacteroidales bacterium]